MCNRHKDEDMNAQENANMNELLASDASVHVMNHVELAISGATMEMAGQWRYASLRRKRGREEEPTELQQEITRERVESKPTPQTVRTS